MTSGQRLFNLTLSKRLARKLLSNNSRCDEVQAIVKTEFRSRRLNKGRRDLLKVLGTSAFTVSASTLLGTVNSTGNAYAAASSSIALPNPLADYEIIAMGINWSEGPVWWGDEMGQLLFSDVPGNTMYRWDRESISVFLSPSGIEEFPVPDYIREGGSNGLALGRGGLLIADSGTRSITFLDLKTRKKRVLVGEYQGKKLNSPNDLVLARNGDVYFTDPPYGLVGVRDSTMRELDFTGVFRLTPDDKLYLIADNLFPNGIALSPDNQVLYVTDSSGWIAIDLDADGTPGAQRVLVSAEEIGGRGDGMKSDTKGNLWCSGPGGIHVFSGTGERIGFAPIEGRVSNCAFSPSGHLFVTNGDKVLRARISSNFL
tara:strand:- start:856 stop:1968 length:1113 start_codon:yes stop_codon:yes gene_type:complete